MRIYTTVQGLIRLNYLPELANAQARYFLTTLRKYRQELPACLHCALSRLQYLSDPNGRDTWLTPAEAFERKGDDCEGLTNLLCTLLTLQNASDLAPLPAVPALAKFGNGRVIHAVAAVRKDQLGVLERFAWNRYPVIWPELPSDYTIIDPSWMCGMPFPTRYQSLVELPSAHMRQEGGRLFCAEGLPCRL